MPPPPPRSQPTGVRRLLALARREATGGLCLTVASVAALVWANVSPAGYRGAWHTEVGWLSPLGVHLSGADWVNQGLLFAFFTVVGLEIRREVTVGELRSLRRALVPIGAALAGMAVPAAIYAAVVAGGAGARGWGIPMATDVAFALGALALIGGASPRGRVFLMTLAVADDVASILILAVFYRTRVDLPWLAGGLVAAAVAAVAWWTRRGPGTVRGLLVLAAWWCMLHTGIEAAVFGVALGLVGPARPSGGRLPRVRWWELQLDPVVNVVILPLFALANVGIRLGGSTLAGAGAVRVFLAVLVARIAGKPLGILAGTVLARAAVTPRGAPRPPAERLNRRALGGIAALTSIGFTVPLLIIERALPAGSLAPAATAALLAGSVAGAGIGAVILRWPGFKPRRRATAGTAPPVAVGNDPATARGSRRPSG